MNANVSGVLIALVGLLILFRYGMPFRVASGGATYIVTEQVNEQEKKTDSRYKTFGYIGLSLAVIGSLMQAYGSWH